MNLSKKLMVITGGTGGHIFPGISIARYLMNRGWHIRWLGTVDRIEVDLVPKYGIEIDCIRVSGLRGKSYKASMIALMSIFSAYLQARSILKHFKPDVVLGMGGYVSGPGVLAAWLLRIPIVIHEQNSIAGLTNKYLAKIANKVFQAFPGALPNAEVVGNPINFNILASLEPRDRLRGRKGSIRVLVIGGSQGALIFNKIMPKVAKKLGNRIVILHQSGKGLQHNIVKQAYLDTGQLQHKVTEFIDNIAVAYNWADIVISRSGALTVSEIATVGLPAIFVPFQHKDRQQYWNAMLLVKVGAAKIFEQSHFTVDVITKILVSWNREILLDMAQKARSISIPNATERIAQEIINFTIKN